MSVPFWFVVRYRTKCGYCDTAVEEVQAVASHSAIPLPVLPVGWRTLDGQPICPGHAITVGRVVKAKKPKRKLNLA